MRYILLPRFFATLSLLLILFSSPLSAQDWIYTIAEGDNLWNLSEQHLDKVTRFEQLRKLNNIDHPKRMQPGTRIRVPLKWIRSNPVPAEILSFNGSAELQRPNATTKKPITKGMMIYLGDSIRTASNSTVAIKFADDSVLTLHENSLVHFDHLSAHGTTGMVDSRLNLLQGRMETKVTPAAGPGSRFEIETPSAISAVRGTIYRAASDEEGAVSTIEVLHGKVAVRGVKAEQLINTGYGTQVKKGEDPLPPQKLLPAPTFNAIPTVIEHVNWQLSWSKVPGAANYRVELTDNPTFETLLWQEVTSYTRMALPDIADGDYAVRIRAIDALSLEGHNQETKVILDAHPQPPLALSPVDNFVLRSQAPTLTWSMSEEADRYRLEIASDVDFSKLVFDKSDLVDSSFIPSSLNFPGNYFWRLSSISSTGEQGPLSPVRSYQIKSIPEKANTQLSTKDDGLFVATWNASSDGQRYHVQLADDKNFNNLVIDQIFDEPKVSFEPTTKNTRYLRVKNIEDDGYEGAWSTTQTIEALPREVSYWPLAIVGALLGVLIF